MLFVSWCWADFLRLLTFEYFLTNHDLLILLMTDVIMRCFVVVIHLNTGRTFLTLMNTSTWLCQINISISKQAFHCHQATAPPGVHSAYLSRLTKPASVQVDGDKNGGNSEEVDHRVDLQPEPQLIIGCYELWEIKRRKKSLFYYFTNKQNK